MYHQPYRTETDSVAARRRKQIDTLKIFNEKVSEIQEDVEYQVEFVAGGNVMAVLVSLPTDFPLEKPILKIIPSIIHPWVNEQSEITDAPGLLNFSGASDLGRVVQAVIRDFELKPPPLASELNKSESKALHPLVNGTTTSPPFSVPFYDTVNNFPDENHFHSHLRTHSATFPELTNLTVHELRRLNESEDRLNGLLDDIPFIKKMTRSIDDLMTQNEELARHNLSKQSELEKLKRQVAEKQGRFQANKQSYEIASQNYKTLCDQYSPENIKEALRAAALRCDEESEKVAERFLNKETNVDTFLDRYIEKRMLSHIRKTKEEKLSHQLTELHKAGY